MHSNQHNDDANDTEQCGLYQSLLKRLEIKMGGEETQNIQTNAVIFVKVHKLKQQGDKIHQRDQIKQLKVTSTCEECASGMKQREDSKI